MTCCRSGPTEMVRTGSPVCCSIACTYACAFFGSAANVRTPFSRQQFHALLAETGWATTHEFRADTSDLQDGAWEVDLALHEALPTIEALPIPGHVRDQLRGQGDLLRALACRLEPRALPAYALTAERFSISEID